MKRSMNLINVTILAGLATATIGCGQGFQTLNAGQNSALRAAEVSTAVKQAEAASNNAQLAIIEANEILKEIQDENGNIKINLFTKSSTSEVQAKFLLNGVIAKLQEVFDRVFEKVATVKAQFNQARQTLADALAKLDTSNPAQAAMIAQLQAELSKLDALETRFSTSMHSLATKLDLAVLALDKVITGATSFIPGWGSLVGLAIDYFLMSDVKALIMELKTKLLAP